MQKFHVSIPYVSVCLTLGRSGERSCNTSIEQTIRLSTYRRIGFLVHIVKKQVRLRLIIIIALWIVTGSPIVASTPQTCGAKPLRVSALLTTEAAITLSRSKQS